MTIAGHAGAVGRAGAATAWAPRLVALDIDGTLLCPGGEIEARVAAAVRRAAASGARILLATGRSAIETAPVLRALGPTEGYAVCSNGAVVARAPAMTTVERVTFDARDVVTRVLAHLPGALVAVEDPGFGYRVTARFPDGELLGEQRLDTLERMLAVPVTRAVVREPAATPESFVELVGRIGLRGVSYAVGYKAWLDLGPPGVSKGWAVSRVARRLGVPAEDCLAIGDGRNDIEMLRWAGRGVAMGNAPAEVRAAAAAVTASVAESGAAIELERWFD